VTLRRALLMVAIPLAVLCLSLFVGRYFVAPADVAHILLRFLSPGERTWPAASETIVLQIRLPRALLALIVGGGLSMSGVAYQGMFRNPLVSPDILGVSAASGFGAALALLLSRSEVQLQLMAFGFGIIGVSLTYLLARAYRSTPMLMLVLSGVIVAAFFSALLSGAKYIADPDSKLPAITYWLLGSLNGASLQSLKLAAAPIVLGGLGLVLVRWRLNLLAMGEDDARALGVRTEWLKAALIVFTTLITAASVSVCGIVGWVGLVIPHVARIWVGPDHRILMPAACSIGATYLLLIDDVARSVSVSEIPLGILTALIGAPFFAYLLRRTRTVWQ
jgi:iron complex transport system permease protein